MIKKITNLKIAHTEKTKQLQLAEVVSLKNKLISKTDWTQLLDSGLRDTSVINFESWRKNVKKIPVDDLFRKKKTHEELLELEKNIPVADFKFTGGELSSFKDDLKNYVLKLAHNGINKTYEQYGYKEFVLIKIEESLNYKTKKYPPNDTFRYKFILQESDITKKVIEEVIEKYLAAYKEINKKMLTADKFIVAWFEKIDSCSNIEMCVTLLAEIEKAHGY
jgi:organic radical activating enzyme